MGSARGYMVSGGDTISGGGMRVASSLKLRLGVTGFACLAIFITHPAQASVCFTSGKVYIQQKVME